MSSSHRLVIELYLRQDKPQSSIDLWKQVFLRLCYYKTVFQNIFYMINTVFCSLRNHRSSFRIWKMLCQFGPRLQIYQILRRYIISQFVTLNIQMFSQYFNHGPLKIIIFKGTQICEFHLIYCRIFPSMLGIFFFFLYLCLSDILQDHYLRPSEETDSLEATN